MLVVVNDVRQSTPAVDEGKRDEVRGRRHQERADRGADGGGERERLEQHHESMPEGAVHQRDVEQRAKRRLEALGTTRQTVSRDLGAEPRGGGVVRGQGQGEVRVDAEQHRNAIEIEQECEQDAEQRVEPEKRRKPEEDAQGERSRRALRRILDVQELPEPFAGPLSRRVNVWGSRRGLWPDGIGDRTPPPSTTTARSSVQTPIRVIGTPP